jgi:hypothetical protein
MQCPKCGTVLHIPLLLYKTPAFSRDTKPPTILAGGFYDLVSRQKCNILTVQIFSARILTCIKTCIIMCMSTGGEI